MTPRRVLVDGVHMTAEMKGVGLYTRNVLAELLAAEDRLRFEVLVLPGAPYEALPRSPRVRYVERPWTNHWLHGLRTVPAAARALGPDSVWLPYEAPALPGRPYAVVCHDVPSTIREAQCAAGDGSGWTRRWLDAADDWAIARTLRGAARVFGNSRYVADWLTSGAGVSPSRVSLAPCAPGQDFAALSRGVDSDAIRRGLDAEGGYILTFFTGDARENPRGMLEAYGRSRAAGLDLPLVVAGLRDGGRAAMEGWLRERPWKEHVRLAPFLGPSRVEELAGFYASAGIYLDLSLHEGFGMQVIEAMACGAPVVCSDRGALPEVSGDAAELVDPEDADRVAAVLVRLAGDAARREELCRLGRRRAAQFTWKRTATAIGQGLLALGGTE